MPLHSMVCHLHDSTAVLKPGSISSHTVPVHHKMLYIHYCLGLLRRLKLVIDKQVDAAVLENLRSMFFDGVKAQFQVSSVQ